MNTIGVLLIITGFALVSGLPLAEVQNYEDVSGSPINEVSMENLPTGSNVELETSTIASETDLNESTTSGETLPLTILFDKEDEKGPSWHVFLKILLWCVIIIVINFLHIGCQGWEQKRLKKEITDKNNNSEPQKKAWKTKPVENSTKKVADFPQTV